MATQGLASAAQSLGDIDRAEALGGEALARWRALPEPGWTIGSLVYLGWMATHERGAHAEAETRFAEALALARTHGGTRGQSLALYNLGWCALLGRSDHANAAALFAESLSVTAGGDWFSTPYCLWGLGVVAASIGRAVPAVRLFGAVEELRERQGYPLQADERQQIAQEVAPARSRLSDTVFSDAWAAVGCCRWRGRSPRRWTWRGRWPPARSHWLPSTPERSTV
jgi:hypothetical protein